MYTNLCQFGHLCSSTHIVTCWTRQNLDTNRTESKDHTGDDKSKRCSLRVGGKEHSPKTTIGTSSAWTWYSLSSESMMLFSNMTSDPNIMGPIKSTDRAQNGSTTVNQMITQNHSFLSDSFKNELSATLHQTLTTSQSYMFYKINSSLKMVEGILICVRRHHFTCVCGSTPKQRGEDGKHPWAGLEYVKMSMITWLQTVFWLLNQPPNSWKVVWSKRRLYFLTRSGTRPRIWWGHQRNTECGYDIKLM